MKKFIITEEEKNRILEMHNSRVVMEQVHTTKVKSPKSDMAGAGKQTSGPSFGVKILEKKGSDKVLYNIDVYGPRLQNNKVTFNYKMAGVPDVYRGAFSCNENKILGNSGESYYLTDSGEKLFKKYCSTNPETGYDYVSTGTSDSPYA